MTQITSNSVVQQQQGERSPWLDYRLTKETMNHLWDMINQHDQGPQSTPKSDQQIRVTSFGGPNNKVYEIEDKNDWFYENVLKECAEGLYYKDWNNYYNVHIGQTVPLIEFVLTSMWVNQQKQHEYVAPHSHGGIYSFVVFMKIPTHWKEQQELPWLKNVDDSHVSDFQFILGQGQGPVQTMSFPLSPEDEGRILFFPAWLMHQNFPFYGTEEERITISGNIMIRGKIPKSIVDMSLNEKEGIVKEMENQIELFRESIRETKVESEKNDDETEKINLLVNANEPQNEV